MADQTFTGEIQSLVFGGQGITYCDGKAVFIPFSASGDQLIYRITKEKQNYAFGEIEKITRSSPDRKTPECPIYGRCGGCQLQHITYPASLKEKSKILENLFTHGLGLNKIPIEEPLPSPSPFSYRNKLQVAVGRNSSLNLILGLYETKTHQITNMQSCLIEQEPNNQILNAVRSGITQVNWEPYSEKEHAGLIRHLLIRSNQKGETALVIIAKEPEIPHWENFLDIVRRKVPKLKSFALNFNPDKTNVVLSRQTKILWGDNFIEETIGSIKFQFSPISFFQVNSLILEPLTEKILEWADPSLGDLVLDAFCGIGTFSIPFSKYCRSVIGIEENAESIHFAKKNAIINNCQNLSFIQGKVEEHLKQFNPNTFKTTFLDPPRKGIEEKALIELIRLNPKKILYLSCNPPTQIRDAKILIKSEYTLKRVIMVDLFPQTAQIESLALFEK
jgi:23S rRNA (uracil1939-C5)-methyltransferase